MFNWEDTLTAEMDQCFEQAMCDHWWVQGNAKIIKNTNYEYLTSHKDHRLYNAVIRVSPHFRQYEKLIEEVMRSHQGQIFSYSAFDLS